MGVLRKGKALWERATQRFPQLKVKGIRQRWLLNSISILVMILLVIRNYYDSSILSDMASKARIAANYFGTNASGDTSSEDYLTTAQNYVSSFEDGTRLELQFLDPSGKVIYSSNGLTLSGTMPGTGDIDRVREKQEIASWQGELPQTGERITAVSAPLLYNGELVGIMRYVTSMRLVDRQVTILTLVAVILSVSILILVYISNIYFVRSIVDPVKNITGIARRIAGGSYGIQVEKKFDDEVGDLTDAINDMSLRINQSEKMKNEFISSVSHELRTPLTSIRGWVETLMTLDDPTDENYRKGLEIINNETGRLNNMVEELLDFSRLQNGRIRMECRPLDLVAELTDAVLFCEARIRQEGLLLHYTEPEEMIPVYADPDRLRQVFINILDNAIKYSAPGGRITVKLWAGEYKAFVEIIDQGRGIPPEDLENVKTKFYKGSNSVRGSGIGLALVDSIMTALDGTLDIKSTLGRGTVVTLGLPLYHKA